VGAGSGWGGGGGVRGGLAGWGRGDRWCLVQGGGGEGGGAELRAVRVRKTKWGGVGGG